MLDNIALVEKYFYLENSFHTGEIGIEELQAGFEEIFDPEFELLLKPRQFTGTQSEFIGIQSIIDVITGNKDSFEDLYTEVLELVADDNQVWIRGFTTGVHVRPYVGIPPLGQDIRVEVFIIFKMAKGKIIEMRFNSDTLSLFLQLGKAILEKNEKEEVGMYINTLQRIGLIRSSKKLN